MKTHEEIIKDIQTRHAHKYTLHNSFEHMFNFINLFVSLGYIYSVFYDINIYIVKILYVIIMTNVFFIIVNFIIVLPFLIAIFYMCSQHTKDIKSHIESNRYQEDKSNSLELIRLYKEMISCNMSCLPNRKLFRVYSHIIHIFIVLSLVFNDYMVLSIWCLICIWFFSLANLVIKHTELSDFKTLDIKMLNFAEENLNSENLDTLFNSKENDAKNDF